MIVISLAKLETCTNLKFERKDDEYFATDNCELGEIKIIANKDYFIKKIEIEKQNFYLNLKEKELS